MSRNSRRHGRKFRGGADLVCYWFAGAWRQLNVGRLERAALVATNSIRGGLNREVLRVIVDKGRIFDAWSDEPWTIEGAAVRVSLISFTARKEALPAHLNGSQVATINADLTGTAFDLTRAARLLENRLTCFEGGQKHGPFEIDGDTARAWLRDSGNPNANPNSDVLRRFVNATDIVRRMSDSWVVDFGADLSESDAALYEAPFEHILARVKPVRMGSSLPAHREFWWRHHRTRPELRKALTGKSRFIATPVVAKHRIFVWLPMTFWTTNLLDAIARDDDTTFGILHSRFHELWALRMGTFLGVGNDPRYTPSTTFETFPFPEGLTPDIPAGDILASDVVLQRGDRVGWAETPDS